MRKVIEGRTYNTETSKIIGSWTNGHMVNDFYFCEETLYKNTKEAYFLRGAGGGYSDYAVVQGDSRGWGEAIIPLTSAQARQWAEKHLDANEYEAEFGEQPEAEGDLKNRERVNLTIDKEVVANMRKFSKVSGISMSVMVDKAIMAMYSKEFSDIE